jgi:vacuolar-type H+-ATPase subunit F/Vma7
MKILVIADPNTCLAFALGGFAVQPVASDTEVLAVIESLNRDEIGLVLITEALAAANRETIEPILLGPGGPLILEIPAITGPLRTRAKATERILSLLRR